MNRAKFGRKVEQIFIRISRRNEHRDQASADDSLGWTELVSVALMTRTGEVWKVSRKVSKRSDVIKYYH